ncbi:MAG: NFACT family protein [Clostridia bacterium]|nr:NFACT family protein [Clostridia bacterium]
MALDGYFLHKIKKEIELYAVGAKVDKVYQPSRDEAVLLLRTRGGTYRLLFSIRADSARVQFIAENPDNPAVPPMLCMLLRKHLCGCTLTAVRQQELDRILYLDFDGTDEIGEKTSFVLCCELMGKHSNLILLKDDMTVVDALKRVDVSTSAYRQVLPGIKYKLPPEQTKLNFLTHSSEELCDAVLLYREKRLSSAVISAVQGVSPFLSREISARVCEDDCAVSELLPGQRKRLICAFDELKESADDAKAYTAVDRTGNPVDFCGLDITQYGNSVIKKEYESCSLLLSDYYGEKTRYERIKNRGQELFRLVGNLCEKTAHRLSVQRQELAECADRDKYRLWAELINANLYRLSKGAFFYDLENYYENYTPVRIPCDPSLSPQKQAQRYYKEYRKLQTAETKLTQLIADGEQELQYLESVHDELTRSETENDLLLIRQELYEQGYIVSRQNGKRKAQKCPEPMKYISPDGFTILAGRNNTQNDRLSLKTAGAGDLFLHTQKIPGSHVIIVSDGKKIPDTTVEFAAGIAAWLSKARQSVRVPVDYTPAKNLKKPVGAKPGKVIYHIYNTIIVDPVKPENN